MPFVIDKFKSKNGASVSEEFALFVVCMPNHHFPPKLRIFEKKKYNVQNCLTDGFAFTVAGNVDPKVDMIHHSQIVVGRAHRVKLLDFFYPSIQLYIGLLFSPYFVSSPIYISICIN